MISTETLIKEGYFPHWIIPPFNSQSLAAALPILENAINKTQRKGPIKPIKYPQHSKCCVHSVPKIKKIRRTIYLPNPVHQIILCELITKNLTRIKKRISNSDISVTSNNMLSHDSDGLPPVFENKQISVQNAIKSFDARFALHADISRFYPTIYTHTIPWAIYGKKRAKQKRSPKLWGNHLDLCARNCQDQQTLGIPTGPYSSHIIAELIASNIDALLCKKLRKKSINFNGYRYIDDYCLFFHNYYDAEFALTQLMTILKMYELEINSNKTKIVELPELIESSWTSEFRYFKFNKEDSDGNPIASHYEIISLFNKAFENSKKFPNENVLKYCLKLIAKVQLDAKDWPLLESLILKCIISEPTCLPVAIKIFINVRNDPKKREFKLNIKNLSDTISEMIRYHSEYNHGYELAWSLWLAKGLKIKLPEDISDILSHCEDPIVVLVSLDLEKSGLLSKKLNYDKWLPLLKKDELYTENWLFSYEVNIKKWLPITEDYVSKDPFFSLLKNNHVDFYDTSVDIINRIRDVDFGVTDYMSVMGI